MQATVTAIVSVASLDYQDGDGTVEISGQIAATCSTGRYELQVSLWDASNYDLTTKKN